MEWLNTMLSATRVAELESLVETWGSLAFLALFLLEMLRLAIKRRFTLNLLGDSVASFLTFGFFIVITYGLIAAAYVSVFYWAYLNYALMEIPVTPASVLLLLVLCDLAYYWEHRFSHRVGVAWATHSVHHSSPYFNISVAYRFGPMDGVWPLFFHLPLALLGFDPILILACEAFVQFYQTGLHTEVVRKLPRPLEAVMNTPSHHRVHHGNNADYIDKNYGGIFIIWDRLFGTFAEEREPVQYGLTEQLESNNPLKVYLHGFARLFRRALASSGFRDGLFALVAPPDWKPGDPRSGPQRWLLPASLLLLVSLVFTSEPGIAEDLPGAPASAVESRAADDASVAGDDARPRLRAIAEAYYAHYLAGLPPEAYTDFSDDALFHYRMDLGGTYGTSEYTFRASDPGGFDDGSFDGYEVLTAGYRIADVTLSDTGGTVDAEVTESYQWEGYTGTMTARERLWLEQRDGRLVIVRFESSQVYR